jgi:hypothetical protein
VSTPTDPWSSGARSRWRGARAHLIPRWRPAPRPPTERRVHRSAIRAVRIEPPTSNGAGRR